MDPKQNQNFILAIVLSMLVLVGWQYFYAMPKMREDQARRELLDQAAKKTAAQTGQSGQAANGAAPGTLPAANNSATVTPGAIVTAVLVPRGDALKRSARVTIDTPAIAGSISLTGARLDDIVFKNYKQTIASDSPNEIFLSPAGTDGAHFVDYGYVTADGQVLAGPEAVWTLASGTTLTDKTPITLALNTGKGVTVRRTIAVDDKYMFTVSDEVDNTSGRALSLQQTVSMFKIGEPKILPQWYLHEGFIGYAGTQGVLEWTWASIKEKPQPFDAQGGWVGITDKYFATVFVPPRDQASKLLFKHLPDGPGVYQADYVQAPAVIADGAKATLRSELFAGAKEVHKLDDYGKALNIPKFSYLMDWGWFYFFTQPLFYLIDWIYRLVGNFGIAILAVTVIVKAAFYPLANRAYESMARMKKLQPEMVKIQERHKDDKARQQQAMMELYKTEKVNPVAGCFPVLLQIPVFFALYKVLFVTIEMRHAPFFGWIKDLSAPDPTNLFNLFGLLPYTIPQTVPFLHLGIWPIIMGITMWLQMQLNPPPPDPVQARIFAWMPVVFTFTLGLFPAGLVIYWAWNNTLTIIQQYVIMRRQGAPVELFDNVMRNLGFATAAQTAAAAAAGGAMTPAVSGSPGTDSSGDTGEQAQRKRTPKPKRNKGDQGQ
jgi:YidC/Oxa1 family membrane protein insertase